MKVSCAAVLLSVSTTSAFNVGYLNQLGSTAAPAKAAPAVNNIVASTGPAGYLDNLQTPELVQAMETAAPAAPAPAAPAAPAAPTSGDYLTALNTVDNSVSGAGLTGYLDALPAAAAPTSGAGMTGYLDAMSGSAPAAPVAAAPVAPAPVAAAPVAAVAPVVAAPAAGDYLSTLHSGSAVSGSGLAGYLDALPAVAAPTAGAGMTGYLDALKTDATSTSGAGLTGYLDALKSNEAVAESTASPSVTSFLENVYSQIMALPADQKTVNGNAVSFNSQSGPYAMSFIKN
jgi:hypothetical protein